MKRNSTWRSRHFRSTQTSQFHSPITIVVLLFLPALIMISDGIDDEEKWLSSGIAGLQQNAFYMHRALVFFLSWSFPQFYFQTLISTFNWFFKDSNNVKDALKYSAQMLSELRTSKLSPHKYYALCKCLIWSWFFLRRSNRSFWFFAEILMDLISDMRAFDELRKLELFFHEETRRGCSIIELYELVQHAGNILPRL